MDCSTVAAPAVEEVAAAATGAGTMAVHSHSDANSEGHVGEANDQEEVEASLDTAIALLSARDAMKVKVTNRHRHKTSCSPKTRVPRALQERRLADSASHAAPEQTWLSRAAQNCVVVACLHAK